MTQFKVGDVQVYTALADLVIGSAVNTAFLAEGTEPPPKTGAAQYGECSGFLLNCYNVNVNASLHT